MNSETLAAFLPVALDLHEGLGLLLPVGFYVLGMAAYAVFVFKFYRFIAARDMFGFDLSKNDGAKNPVLMDLLHLIWYAVKYIVLFPGFAAFWFAVLTMILIVLSKDQGLAHILVISLATVSVIRITAYYNENLSRDLAKILPFAVLGVFLINASFFSLDASLLLLGELSGYWETIAYYMMALVALELLLRSAFGFYCALFPGVRRRKADREASVAPAARRAARAPAPDTRLSNPPAEPPPNGMHPRPAASTGNVSHPQPAQPPSGLDVREQLRDVGSRPSGAGAAAGRRSNAR